MWASSKGPAADRRARFERRLQGRPLDRNTLLAYQEFLFCIGDFTAAERIFDRSLQAGNDGFGMRLRMARVQLALMRAAHNHHVLDGTHGTISVCDIEERRGRLEKAMDHLTVCAEEPQLLSDAESLFECAGVLFSLCRFGACITLLHHLLARHSGHPLTPFAAWMNAHAYVAKNAPHQALECVLASLAALHHWV